MTSGGAQKQERRSPQTLRPQSDADTDGDRLALSDIEIGTGP